MRLSHLVEYLLFQMVASLVQLLPLSGARWLGRSLGRFTFVVLRYRRDVTLGNLHRALPEKTKQELEKIARGAYENVGISLLELIWFPRMSPERLRQLFHFDRPEIVTEARRKGKGLLLLTAHFGNWEYLAQSIITTFGFPINIIVKTQANRLVDRSINRRRERIGNKIIPMETSLRDVLKALRNGEAIGLVADQAAPKENVSVEFFGTMVPTHQGPSVFSLKMGTPLVAIFSVRRPDNSYDAYVVQVPSEDLNGYTEENATELTRRHVRITEEFIRKYPDHWMWMHKRWKHVPLEGDAA